MRACGGRQRLLVFCVSEMAPALVEKWAPDLPTLSRLAQDGVRGCTRYEVPYYLTPQMWATINTGVSAGRHGVFDYRQRAADGSFRETTGADVDGRPWWEYLEDAGISAGVVNVPMTYPPAIRRGFMISGQDAPGDHPSIMRPERLWHEMRSRFGRHHLKDAFPGGQDKLSYAKKLAAEIDRQSEVFAWLAARPDWDCLVLYTSVVAMAQHYYWSAIDRYEPWGDVVHRTFAGLDRMLSTAIAAVGEELNVCVVSECGAGELVHGVNLNAALASAGLLAFSQDGTASLTRTVERRLLTSIREKAQRWLPKSLFYAANRSRLRHRIMTRLATQGIDWSRTRAYHRGKGEGNIYINLAGRDPYGIVRPEEVPALTDEIRAAVMALETHTGERPAQAVHRREDLFRGPHVGSAPDLVIEWRDAAFMPSERDHENDPVFGERWREYMSWPTTGSHRPEGVFIAAGPGFEPRALAEPVGLLQLAPLWLALCGVAPPPHMQGALRREFLSKEAAALRI